MMKFEALAEHSFVLVSGVILVCYISSSSLHHVLKVEKRIQDENKSLLPRGAAREKFGTEVSESCEWLNFIISSVIDSYRNEPKFQEGIRKFLERNILQACKGYIYDVSITRVNLGTKYPKCNSVDLLKQGQSGKVLYFNFAYFEIKRIRINVGFEDYLEVYMKAYIDVVPMLPKLARFPVAFSLVLRKVSGKISVQIVPSANNNLGAIRISFEPALDIVLEAASVLGENGILKTFKKLDDLIKIQVKNLIIKKIVYPSFLDIPLVNFTEVYVE